jgi:HD superfamily phosphohydrolase YqeK
VGADVVRRKGWLKNAGDIDAIRSHTLGSKKMTKEEKILFIADMAEPKRPYPAARTVRLLAMRDLHAAFREAFMHKMGHQLRKGRPLFPHAVRVWNTVVCHTKHS